MRIFLGGKRRLCVEKRCFFLKGKICELKVTVNIYIYICIFCFVFLFCVVVNVNGYELF